MMHLRSAFTLVELSLLMAFCANSDGQKVSASVNQQELSLNRSNDGQHISVKIGQPIVVTLQTIGGVQYDTPQISSRAIRFESVAFAANRIPVARRRSTVSLRLPREKPKSESRTQVQTQVLHLRFRSQTIDRSIIRAAAGRRTRIGMNETTGEVVVLESFGL
jgi:hypothetical protein